jgi:hypothetical protein
VGTFKGDDTHDGMKTKKAESQEPNLLANIKQPEDDW